MRDLERFKGELLFVAFCKGDEDCDVDAFQEGDFERSWFGEPLNFGDAENGLAIDGDFFCSGVLIKDSEPSAVVDEKKFGFKDNELEAEF
jgi:hypothetical protein